MRVAPMRYDVIFKKAFREPKLFKALVKDFLQINDFEIDEVENDKAFFPAVGNVNFKFDLFAEDRKNRIIVEIQHAHYSDTYERFLYYQCSAMVESIKSSKNYSFPMTVNTLVFFTKKRTPSPNGGILEVDFQARDTYDGKVIEKVFGNRKHRLLFVHVQDYSIYSSDECSEWMEALDDTFDYEVSLEKYENSNIEKMFERIKESEITPDELAEMKEEHNREEAEQGAIQEGWKKGLDEGLKRGKKKTQEENARNLLALGILSIEQIASSTGLTVEEVEAISTEIQPQ